MSENTLKFDNIEGSKKEFHKSKQPIDLNLAKVDQLLISDKFKYSGSCFEYFIEFKEDETVKLLCIILPQMSGCIKYFENGGKNMLSKWLHNMILWWINVNKFVTMIKKALNIKFHDMLVYDEKYITAKVRELILWLKQTL